MHRVDLGAQTPHHLFPENFHTATGTPADWCNTVQEEICSVIESTGHALTDQTTQLNQTITAILHPSRSYFIALSSWKNSDYSQRLHIEGGIPFDLTGLGAIEFYITFVFKPDHLDEFNYTTLKQSFLKVDDRWISSATPGERVITPSFEVVTLLQNGGLTLNTSTLRLVTAVWNEVTSQLFKPHSPKYTIKGCILSHIKRYPA